MHSDIRETGTTAATGDGVRHTSRQLRSTIQVSLWAVSLAVAMAGPASAEFVCNAKTKLVNVFLEPPSYRKNTVAPAEGVNWSPADVLEKPFDIVDTLPSGTRVKTRAVTGLSANIGDWNWIAFRHTQTGLVAQGWIHESKLSSIPCDGDPGMDLSWLGAAPDGPGEPYGYRARLDETFEPTLDDPPHEGTRGAKRFQGTMRRRADSNIAVECERPGKEYALPKELGTGSDLVDPYILACTRALAANPHYLKALIIRGDLFHRFARTPASGVDSKSTTWAADVKRRKAAQERAIADWTRASLYVRKDELPMLLQDRLAPTGAAGYEVK